MKLHGADPVKVTVRLAVEPEQIVVEPEMTAVALATEIEEVLDAPVQEEAVTLSL